MEQRDRARGRRWRHRCRARAARAGRTELTGRHGDALKIRVAAPPVEGRATEAARVALAEALGVAPAAVSLVTGESSRLKRFRIEGVVAADAIARVGHLASPRAGGDDRNA